MQSRAHQLLGLGQSVWLDFIRRGHLLSGEFDALVRDGRITLHTNTLVRRLHTDARGRITHASANATAGPERDTEYRAKHFVLAAGFAWSPHLLLLSKSARYPDGLANRSGLVGKYLCGHRNVAAQIRLPLRLFPGLNVQHSLVTKKFMRPGTLDKYLRHDLRVWESAFGSEPRIRDDKGEVLFGDAMLADWRARAATGVARVRGYYDVLPAKESELTLDASAKNRWGDPMPRLQFRDAPESVALRGHSEDSLRALFREMARAGDGRVISNESSANDIGQEHPGGGCRMGHDPATSVVDSFGRAHDHENLVIAGGTTQENPPQGPAGDIRAWDMRTGKVVWKFHSIPQAGEKYNDTWAKDSWINRTGVNI